MAKTLHFLPIGAARTFYSLLVALSLFATPAAPQSLQERMLQAEDARPTTEAGLAPLREGLQGGARRTAIRSSGRK
jgi:hypothetical protein